MKNDRRSFLKTTLKTTAAGATGLMILNSRTAFGTQANSAVQIGIIGCGGRGIYIGNYFLQHAEARIVAAADPFTDRLENAQKRFQLPADKLFKGLDGYKALIAKGGFDAVAIESPPYFHPEQADAAVKAGKHVFLAKPVAVDAPGTKSIIASAEKAAGRLSFLVDFQTRVRPVFVESAERVHNGAIGMPVCGQVYYHAGRLRPQTVAGAPADENRLRNWVFDKVLSGDILVEQNVHVLDVADWYLKGHPLKASGTGGRRGRTDVGDCWDHFMVHFWYPNEVRIDFSSSQFTKGYSDLCIRLYGTTGTIDSHYGGAVRITGDQPWSGTDKDDTFNGGAITNVKNFVDSIKMGKFLNNSAQAAQSSYTTILGRMAAYEGRTVTWEEMLKSKPLKAELKL